MTFKIFATVSGAVSVNHRQTAKEAIEKALELMGAGLSVHIVAPDGATYQPVEFPDLLLNFGAKNADRT